MELGKNKKTNCCVHMVTYQSRRGGARRGGSPVKSTVQFLLNELEPRVLCALGKRSATQPHPQVKLEFPVADV